MRRISSCIVAGTIFAMAALATDPGMPARPSPKDYPAMGRADGATIAAAILPPNQVSKMFSTEIAKQYIVVEVAIYPDAGQSFDVQPSAFALRVGQRIGRADRPIDVVPWRERRDPGRTSPVDVTTETGVIYQRSNDPVYGRRQDIGTYTGVSVESPSRVNASPPSDPRIVDDKVQSAALAEGLRKVAAAGYLYFPQSTKRKKSEEIELKYAQGSDAVNLLLVKP